MSSLFYKKLDKLAVGTGCSLAGDLLYMEKFVLISTRGEQMFQYEARVLRIVDGDTLWLDVDLGFKVRMQTDVRLAHVNAPEVVNYTLDGITNPAIVYLNQCVPVGSVCIVDILRAEKYGRWLGVTRYLKGSTSRDEILRKRSNLNDELVNKGFAKIYKG